MTREERGGDSEKPNQQLLLIVAIHMSTEADGGGKTNILMMFPAFIFKNLFVKN